MARRYHVEDLVRLRPAGEQRRYLASQRAGRVDPNPHQIDAVIFALQRIEQGGCILADEVGLGKTIEAGLVIAQLRAEGKQRILLITPKPLIGQWKQELAALFGIEVIEGTESAEGEATARGFEGPGVFIVGREAAGSERGAQTLRSAGAFDLCVIDEAHEIFAGIYRRFDRHGRIKDGSRYAKTAARVRSLLAQTPVLLLTATPIQNSLAELWGLVQYVEPTGTLLGDLATFRTVFCEGDDRTLRPGQGDELRRRIAQVCQRTLRRQAEAFMDQEFRRRTARLFEYEMSEDERALYDDVTQYLLDPETIAFAGNHRRLLILGFHRRMASSVRALAASLDSVAQRLRRRIEGTDDATERLFADDLEEEVVPTDPETPRLPTGPLQAELSRVQELAQRARALCTDSKAQTLLEALRYVLERGRRGDGTGKVVIFTEALTTQDYLREILVEAGLVSDEEVTLFRGQNAGPRAQQALDRWFDEIGSKLPVASRPSRSVAVRLALVHEFATRSKVFIATEAGAKGLNLQFCESIINYDLPWNPQRIEQRIGRCHRYGQQRDVVVINFLARDNEAQRRTFEILSRKLDLFGTVLSASDVVLYESSQSAPQMLVSALGAEFEARMEQIYERARSQDEIDAELRDLDQRMTEARDDVQQAWTRTSGLIETRLDETVRAAFKDLDDELPQGLASFDEELRCVATRYLDAVGVAYRCHEEDGRIRIDIEPDAKLPIGLREGFSCTVGRRALEDELQPLHLGHPLIRAAVDEARRATRTPFTVRIEPPDELVTAFAEAGLGTPGRRGRLTVLKVCHDGFEPRHDLVEVALLQGSDVPLAAEAARSLVLAPARDVPGRVAGDDPTSVDDEAVRDAVEEALFVGQADVELREQVRFEETIARLERYMDDRVLVVRRSRAELLEQLAEAKARRDAAVGSDARTRAEAECAEVSAEIDACNEEIDRLLRRDDEHFQACRARAHQRRYAPLRVETMIEAEFVLG